jgi:hypothetical protein
MRASSGYKAFNSPSGGSRTPATGIKYNGSRHGTVSSAIEVSTMRMLAALALTASAAELDEALAGAAAMTSAYRVREVCESHGEAIGTDLAMTLLSKKAAGLGFVLLGGLAALTVALRARHGRCWLACCWSCLVRPFWSQRFFAEIFPPGIRSGSSGMRAR